MKRKKKKII